MAYIDYKRIAQLNNNKFALAYKKAQSPMGFPRNREQDYVHVSSVLKNQCPRFYFYEYKHRNTKFQSVQNSTYSQTIFKIGSTLEQDRISTLIEMQPQDILFFGTWRCSCVKNSVAGARTPLDKRFYNICTECGENPHIYDEYQFKVQHIGISGRPDLCLVSKENGKYFLSIYELKTVMKSDFVHIHKNNTYQSIDHVKQSSVYYWFFKWLLKTNPEELTFIDANGEKAYIEEINPVITILYMDKRDDKYEPPTGEENVPSIYKQDWFKGDPNYFYTYNALEPIELTSKSKTYLNFFDKQAIDNNTYIKTIDGKQFFYTQEYMGQLAKATSNIREHKINNVLPVLGSESHPCMTNGIFSDDKARKLGCSFASICKNNLPSF